MKQEILHLSRIEKQAKDYSIHDVNMHIFRGEIVGLLGLSKTGKSAIVHILTGSETPDSGSIMTNDRIYSSLNINEAKRSGIYSLGFSNYIIKNLTVYENLFAFQRSPFHFSFSRREMIVKAEYVLQQFHLDLSATALAKDISQTNQALICLIKIALADPNLIIIDSGIEYQVEDIEPLIRLINHLKKTGISFLIVSNKISRLISECDCFYSIKENTLSNRIDAKSLSPDSVPLLLVDRIQPQTNIIPVSYKKTNPVLKVTSLRHKNSHPAISFELYKGEMALLIPPSNIIPDTIANCLFGLIPRIQGDIYVNQKQIELKSSRDAIDNGIAFIPDEPDMTLFQNMNLPDNLLLPYYSSSRFLFHPISPVFRNVATTELKKGYAIQSSDSISAIKKSKPSIAEIHRISIARWEALKPQIYIFLNPFNVVDEGGTASMLSQMKRLADTGCAVLIISNNPYGLESSNIRTIKFQ